MSTTPNTQHWSIFCQIFYFFHVDGLVEKSLKKGIMIVDNIGRMQYVNALQKFRNEE